MKRIVTCLMVSILTVFYAHINAGEAEPLKFKGFYIGMSRSQVQEVYKKLQANKVAEYISIEKENYRDLIKIDNEFSSMGNKVEIFYDESEKVSGITFQYKTVNILFNGSSQSAEEFVNALTEKYELPEMEVEDMGITKIWKCQLEKEGLKISVDGSKNLRIQMLKK